MSFLSTVDLDQPLATLMNWKHFLSKCPVFCLRGWRSFDTCFSSWIVHKNWDLRSLPSKDNSTAPHARWNRYTCSRLSFHWKRCLHYPIRASIDIVYGTLLAVCPGTIAFRNYVSPFHLCMFSDNYLACIYVLVLSLSPPLGVDLASVSE